MLEGGVCQINPLTETRQKEKCKKQPHKDASALSLRVDTAELRILTSRGDKSFSNPNESKVFAPVRAGSGHSQTLGHKLCEVLCLDSLGAATCLHPD